MSDLSIFARNRVEWFYRLARDARINASAVRVGLVIGTFLNEDRNEVRPSYSWLMEAACIKNKSTLSNALTQLEKTEYLVIDRFGGQCRNAYGFPFDDETLWSKNRT
jgi:hypothetical protein